MQSIFVNSAIASAAIMLTSCASAQHTIANAASTSPAWVQAERGMLENHVQLTHERDFIKAGEQYFSPDDSMIIFQAIERPEPGEEAEAFYQMFVADVVYHNGKRIQGIENIRQLSPKGSSNTCGWFHPTKPGHVIFGSTLVPPADPARAGFQREGSKYEWQFPQEMTIVECDLSRADGTAESLKPIVSDPDAYVAECAISSDGRYLVYCKRTMTDDVASGDLVIRDLSSGQDIIVAGNDGYDGGPFFSPDGSRLCYRSDRRGDDLLQIFVAELAFDRRGAITGVDREFQLTDNAHVNWAPYWHPSGKYLVYATSQMGHQNYEVFMIDADGGGGSAGEPTKYGTRKRRITHADKFDGLPVFNSDGSVMMWTSQRGADTSSQIWAAEFVLPLDQADSSRAERVEPRETKPEEVHVTDPDSGTIYIYDPSTHAVTAYNPETHATRTVEDTEELERVMRLFRQQP